MTDEKASERESPFFTADMTIDQKLQMLNFNIQALRATNKMHENEMNEAAKRMSAVKDSLDYDVIINRCVGRIQNELDSFRRKIDERIKLLEVVRNEEVIKLNTNLQNFKTKMKKDCAFDREYATGTHTLLCKTIIRMDKMEERLKDLAQVLESKKLNLWEKCKQMFTNSINGKDNDR
jgi:hypothetical protein